LQLLNGLERRFGHLRHMDPEHATVDIENGAAAPML